MRKTRARGGGGSPRHVAKKQAQGQRNKGTKDWDESRSKKTAHIGVIQRIREQNRVSRSGGLVGLIWGDVCDAVRVVFFGYDD